MTPAKIFASIHQYGQENENPAIVQKYARYFKEGYDAYGLTHDQVQFKVDEILTQPGINQDLILEATLLLIRSPKYEMTVIAIRMVLSCKKFWTIATFKTIEQWFSIGITNWAQTDYICGEVMNLLFKKKIIELHDLAPWRLAENKFQRRAAVVSLIKPMKLSTDFIPFFSFIEPLMHDTAREVHQGLGWFLRESWKKKPEITEGFLMKFRETAPRLIFQYATEKMDATGKERFRRTVAAPA